MGIRKLIIILGCLYGNIGFGQADHYPSTPSISVTTHVGKIKVHTPKIDLKEFGNSVGLEVSFLWQTRGKRAWEQFSKYPKVGFTTTFFDLGNDQTLGQAIGLLPIAYLPVIRRPKWQLQFVIGGGLAYLTKYYDRETNPTNNAIGSSFNNITALRLLAEVKVTPKWMLQAGGSFTHFSNAAMQLPNYGLNIPAFNIGMNYSFRDETTKWYDDTRDPHPKRRWGVNAYVSHARQEYISYYGPKYPIWTYSMSGTYALSKINKLFAGIDFEQNESIVAFSRFLYRYENHQKEKDSGKRIALFGGDEIFLGNVSLLLQLGVYITRYQVMIPKPTYLKLGLRYYVPQWWEWPVQVHVGAYLKSHNFDAEYIAGGIGVAF